MHARVATAQLKSGAAGELVQRGQQLAQQLREVKGFQSGYALVDHQTNQLITITFFDTEEDARAYGESSVRAQAAQLIGQAAGGEPSVSIYEVVLQD